MASENVGAGILNIITESLYDKPIVVFREYVQNAVDSFLKTQSDTVKVEDLVCKICFNNNNLYFFDNGNGINKDKFENIMRHIAFSEKKRTVNIGYKGIGRLSGISYCQELEFVNILNFNEKQYQKFIIDCKKYNVLKEQDSYREMSFDKLMDQIGIFYDLDNTDDNAEIESILKDFESLFTLTGKGFLVILKEISPVLEKIIEEDNDKFLSELGWLLPVGFKDELFNLDEKELFEEFSQSDSSNPAIAPGFNILYNDFVIERPIDKSMLRDYTCKFDFGYGKGFFTFRKNKIIVEKSNQFSGIKVYIDNMLLCDETELIPMLLQYGYLNHSSNELFQTVNAIGAMIYVIDKVSITANARRTFIEVTDNDSLLFLEKITAFIEKVYKARYSLSKYSSAKKSLESSDQKVEELKDKANEALQDLASVEINIPSEDADNVSFSNLSETEKKQVIKRKLTKEVNEQIKLYLAQVTVFDFKNAFEDFKLWLRTF